VKGNGYYYIGKYNPNITFTLGVLHLIFYIVFPRAHPLIPLRGSLPAFMVRLERLSILRLYSGGDGNVRRRKEYRISIND
jgi:hypothetical protein